MLIGNSLINTICTTIATSLFIDLIEDHSVATILYSAVMAFLIIVFAEFIPKAYCSDQNIRNSTILCTDSSIFLKNTGFSQ